MSSPNTPQPAASWQVTMQQETVDAGPSGQYVQGVRVYFTTGNGHTGSVFVPKTEYNVNNVRRAVAAQAAIVAGVAGLTSNG